MRVTAEQPVSGTREDYVQILRWMCMTKALDDRMHTLVKQGRAPFVGSNRGHEGLQVACAAALGPEDWLVPHYRGHGSAVTRGLTAREWMLAVFPKAADPMTAGRNIPGGCFGYRKLRIASVSQVVASWLPKAVGIAYAARLRNENTVVLCTFGEGATSEGDFHEALNFAGVHRLPVVFVCENNGYAISVPLSRQAANPRIAERAAGYAMPGISVDGTDVPAVYACAQEAVARAREGRGPTLIEGRIWRINSHTSEDNQAKYRAPEELEAALARDPLLRFEDWLVARGWINRELALKLHAECEEEASQAADWAEAQPDPLPQDALRHVYCEDGG